FLSCSNRPVRHAEEIYRPGFLQEEKEGVELRVSPAHIYDSVPEKVRLEISNRSGSTIQFGAGYRIEMYDQQQDRWIAIGPPEGTAVIAVMYLLENGHSQVYEVALYPEKIMYTYPGSYRISKSIFLPDEHRDFHGSFVLMSPE
ncbi:MAG: hypothetical protein LUD68_02830, partial [Rikenellaceae bacterium]|nr:hypothetical protein [Rikenellaceae bacterium]